MWKQKRELSALTARRRLRKSSLDGLDSLLSVVQMPKGVPVATVAVDGAENAGILAVQILSTKYPELRQAIKDYKQKMAEDIIKLDEEFRTPDEEKVIVSDK